MGNDNKLVRLLSDGKVSDEVNMNAWFGRDLDDPPRRVRRREYELSGD